MSPVTATPVTAFTAATSGNHMLISSAPNATTLLNYAALVQPDPLQVSTAGTITLAISNPSHQIVTVTTIELTLSVGTSAKNLSSSLEGLEVMPTTGWSATSNNGIVVLTPNTPDDAKIGPNGLSVVLTSFTVNDQCGTTTLSIDETASSPGQPAADRASSIGLPKFPAQFQVGALMADPYNVANGATTTLNWVGTAAAGTTYQMNYIPADTGSPVSDPVGNTGPYPTVPLTRTSVVVFNLIVSTRVPGQDQPLVVQRQTAVTVSKLTALLSAKPSVIAPNGLVHLEWSTLQAVRCTLNPQIGQSQIVGPQGEAYLTLASTRTFTLNAYDASGNFAQSLVTIAVDPTIKPTQSGFVIPAVNGEDGESGGFNLFGGHDGHPGGPGRDAILNVTAGPIDPSPAPANVIPLSATGGNGGAGGSGGNGAKGGDGGPGGPGGRAALAATLAPNAGVAAQYIVTIAAGSGGPGGSGGSGVSSGSTGSRGPDGSIVSMRVNGVPLIVFP